MIVHSKNYCLLGCEILVQQLKVVSIPVLSPMKAVSHKQQLVTIKSSVLFCLSRIREREISPITLLCDLVPQPRSQTGRRNSMLCPRTLVSNNNKKLSRYHAAVFNQYHRRIMVLHCTVLNSPDWDDLDIFSTAPMPVKHSSSFPNTQDINVHCTPCVCLEHTVSSKSSARVLLNPGQA